MVLIQNYNEVKQYKKTIILILCLIISLSLISCTKSVETINTTSESSYSSNDNAKKESTTKPSSNSNEQNEKSITSLYVSYGGIKIDITSDQDEIDEIVANTLANIVTNFVSGIFELFSAATFFR